MSLSRIRAELSRLWGPEERNALSQAFTSAGVDYRRCVVERDTQVILDKNCYRTQGTALKERYKQLWRT
ncbi:MAG: hypothetical protein QXK71_07890 [Pyrobaculum sp.]